jgi:translation initiation factor IF-2
LAKRISDLAKDLNVKSTAIIQKCLDEGIPSDKVKSHASTVSPGLEATIREWFGSGTVATAVENTPHIDHDKVKPATARRKASSKAGEHDDHGELPAEAKEVKPQVPAPAAPSASVASPAAPATSKPSPAAKAPESESKPAVSVAPSAPATGEKSTGSQSPASSGPVAAAPTAPASSAPQAARPLKAPEPAADDDSEDNAAPAAPIAAKPIPPAPPAPPAPVAPIGRPNVPTMPANANKTPSNVLGRIQLPPRDRPMPGGSGGAGPGMRGPARPMGPGSAPGPTVIRPVTPGGGPAGGPAGPGGSQGGPGGANAGQAAAAGPGAPGSFQLQKATVGQRGPIVVRVEAPEQIDTRPRGPRPGGSTGGGYRPGGAGGRGVTGGGAGTDASRRNNRRGPGGAPGAAPAVPPKRKIRDNADEMSTEGRTGFTEADLAEREERLARSAGYLKQRRREEKARLDAQGRRVDDTMEGQVEVIAPFTIGDLSKATGIKAADIIKKLFMQGVMATINTAMDSGKAQEIMIDFDIELVVREAKTAEETVEALFTDRKSIDVQPRPPVVTIMGHVDHGKTSLLDAIRNANVASGEAGGITQKTSAFKVSVTVNDATKTVVFIDTPGHEAFTEMRARGANVTDVVVLVVGAPEGVMPQTVESINHARAAKVPIVVALNKCDSPQATDNQIQKVYGQLAEHGLNPVAWGGEVEVIKTSAIKKTGIIELLEILDLQTEILQLKADFQGSARGRVVEAGRDEGRGALATIMVQEGQLKVGDFIVVGRAFGRVRDITDDMGKRIKTAGPSTPVQISGIDEVPSAGDAFFVTETLRQAEEAAEQRRIRDRETALHQPKVTLDSLFSQMKDATVKEILVVLKADVQGSVDVIKNQIEKLSSAEVKVRVLHAAVGGITESDVVLADASKAVIVGFNVIPANKARQLADQKGVEIRTYQVIYDIVDDVRKAASGMLEPEIRQEVLGHAEVRKVFNVTRVGTIAGCYITDGTVQRDALIRVTRNGVVIVNDRVLEQLKRFKDDAKEVKANMECGMKIVGYDDIKEGDVLECYKKVEVKRTL